MRICLVLASVGGCSIWSAPEVCGNRLDDDRNDAIDCRDPACARHCDSDGDGYIDLRFRRGTDCDDLDPRVHPDAPEVCNGIDDDCDDLVDDADPGVDDTTRLDLFEDLDGDGVGSDTPARRCPQDPHAAPVAGDCDDSDPSAAPGRSEVCDGVDNDCDGLVDAADPELLDAVTVFEDRDLDGHGNPAVALPGCPTEGWSLDALDCNDRHPYAYALAPEVCDGVDDDCDGLVGPEEEDADGDGDPVCSDCDDHDPERSSRTVERCNGIDDDCDGLVDEADPSLDPYSCGYCPDASAAAIAAMSIHEETWNPCLLDPATEAMCSSGDDPPDTHTQGRRLHRVSWRDDQEVWRDELFLFLPPGPGRENEKFRSWVEFAGYRTIALGYPNDDEDTCEIVGDASDCFLNVRYESIFGVDLSNFVEISPADSIVGRLSVLLDHLAVRHFDMGFDRYLLPDGSPDWSRIIVAGWSGGGGHSALLSQYEPVAGVLLMSSPTDQSGNFEIPASWIATPGATPGCARFASWHRLEPGGQTLIPLSLDLLGLPETVYDLDGSPDPQPAGTHRIVQSVFPEDLPQICTPHGMVARDPCMRSFLASSYVRLLCDLGDVDPLTCADTAP